MAASDGRTVDLQDIDDESKHLNKRKSTNDEKYQNIAPDDDENDDKQEEQTECNWDREFIMGVRTSEKIDDVDEYDWVSFMRPLSSLKFKYIDRDDEQIDAPAQLRQICVGREIYQCCELPPELIELVVVETIDIVDLYFKEIEIQWSTKDGFINYIRLNNHKIGRKEYNDMLFKSHLEIGKLLITGIYSNKNGPTAFQVVDVRNGINTNPLVNIFEDFKKNVKTNSLINIFPMYPNQSLSSVNNKNKYNILKGIVGVADNDVLTTVLLLLTWCCRRFSIDPTSYISGKFFAILEKCIDGDMDTIHSVLTLNRFINNIIEKNFKNNLDYFMQNVNKIDWEYGTIEYTSCLDKILFFFGEDKQLQKGLQKELQRKQIALLKTHKWWSSLSETVQIIKRMNYYTPTIDIFTLTYLHSTYWNIFTTIITFIGQIGMTMFIISSLEFDIIDESMGNISSIVASIIICCIVTILVKKQIIGVLQFFAVFPESKSSWSMVLGVISNIIIAAIIVPLNFIILAITDDNFDLVLNSLAILFILEIDDQIIDINPIDEKAIYLSYFHAIMIDKIVKIDGKYKMSYTGGMNDEVVNALGNEYIDSIKRNAQLLGIERD
eukprot:121559_1